MFKNYKESNWLTIVLAVAAFVIMTLIWLNPLLPIAIEIGKSTKGIIHPTLVIGLSNFVLIMGSLNWFGKLRWSDFGLIRSKLKPAVVLTVCLWLLLNLILVVLQVVQGSEIVLAEDWHTKGLIVVLGILISQLFGNALIEETLFRGFLIPQIYFKLKGSNQKRKLFYAALLSLIAFTLPHLGNLSNISEVGTIETMLLIFIMGAIFTLLYLRTKNIFLTIGCHALFNTPTPIFQGPPDWAEMIFGAYIILLILLWNFLPESLTQKSNS